MKIHEALVELDRRPEGYIVWSWSGNLSEYSGVIFKDAEGKIKTSYIHRVLRGCNGRAFTLYLDSQRCDEFFKNNRYVFVNDYDELWNIYKCIARCRNYNPMEIAKILRAAKRTHKISPKQAEEYCAQYIKEFTDANR